MRIAKFSCFLDLTQLPCPALSDLAIQRTDVLAKVVLNFMLGPQLI